MKTLLLILWVCLLCACSKEADWYCNSGTGTGIRVCQRTMVVCESMLSNLHIDDFCVLRHVTAWGFPILYRDTGRYDRLVTADQASCETLHGVRGGNAIPQGPCTEVSQ